MRPVARSLVFLASCCAVAAARRTDVTFATGATLNPDASCDEKGVNKFGAQCLHEYKCHEYSAPIPAGVSGGLSNDHFYFTIGGYMCKGEDAYIITNEHNLNIDGRGPASLVQPSMSSADHGPKSVVVSNVKHAVAHRNEDYAIVQVDRKSMVGTDPQLLGASTEHRMPIMGMLNEKDIQAEIEKGSDMYFSGRMAGWCGLSLSNFEYVKAEEDFLCTALYPGLGACLRLKDSVGVDKISKAAGSNCAATTDLCYPGNSGSLGYVLRDGKAYAVAMLANAFSYLQPIVEIAKVVGGDWTMCEPSGS